MNPPINTGHGHVTPRADGLMARCGGPAICPDCRLEAAALSGALVIDLPFATPSLNELMHWKHRTLWRYSKFRESCAFMLRGKLNERGLFFDAKPNQRMRLIVERHCSGQGLDAMNLSGGCKPLVDAMVKENMLHNDTPQWLEDYYTAVIAPRGVKFTRLFLEPSTKAPPVNKAGVSLRKGKRQLELVPASEMGKLQTPLGELEF